jgi:hypothetical protein
MKLPVLSCKRRLPDDHAPASRAILYALSQVTRRLAIWLLPLSGLLKAAPVVSKVQAAVDS